jgi:hypothetical protein
VFLSVHSGTQELFAPYAYQQKEAPNYSQLMGVLDDIDKGMRVPFGSAAATIGKGELLMTAIRECEARRRRLVRGNY